MNACLKDLAEDYFNFLAKSFPIMCASDEFLFLPRAQAAGKYLDLVDNLQEESIFETISILKGFRREFDRLSLQEINTEEFTDLELLKSSVAGALIELEVYQNWRHNPLLYLKIAFIGLDQAWSKPASCEKERNDRTCTRLEGIPQLLKQAMNNVEKVPKIHLEAALTMLRDGKEYLKEFVRSKKESALSISDSALDKILNSLKKFDNFLHEIVPVNNLHFYRPVLTEILREHYRSPRTLHDIFQLAEQEMQENLAQLNKIGSKIKSGKFWLELYDSYMPNELDNLDTLSIYGREIESLSNFFQKNGFVKTNLEDSFELCETPTYLRSIRSSASFSAALNTQAGEKDFFYITTGFPQKINQGEKNAQKNRLHREYKFLSAHEVIPGHHQLDYQRRKQKSCIRRQIESPLFYEGWAYYAETLLSEYGYVEDLWSRLIDHKRRLWRAARCKIDVGMNTGILSREESLKILAEMGFNSGEAARQMNRIQVNPGYQLCYTLGRHEIMNLRQNYGKKLGLSGFHHKLLEGGELPFQLIEKRLKLSELDNPQPGQE
jgi:hypothetical protein